MIKELREIANELTQRGLRKEAGSAMDIAEGLKDRLKAVFPDGVPDSIQTLMEQADLQTNEAEGVSLTTRESILATAKEDGDLLTKAIEKAMVIQQENRTADLQPILQLAQQVTDALYRL